MRKFEHQKLDRLDPNCVFEEGRLHIHKIVIDDFGGLGVLAVRIGGQACISIYLLEREEI